MSYSHFSIIERSQLEILHHMNWSTRDIAKALGQHHASIARELSRNNTVHTYYSPEAAQESYRYRRQRATLKVKLTPTLKEYIEDKFAKTWSPEQVAATLKDEKVCFKSIYRWLYQGLLVRGDVQVLRHKGKRRKPVEKRGRFNIGKSICNRPEEVKKRETFGHWELDTVVFSRGKSKACVATFVERKTRAYFGVLIPDRTAVSMEHAFNEVNQRYIKGAMCTATVDRGKEFACHERLEASHDVQIYFADPYSSWQRGSNENANGLLREFFPKKTDFALVTPEMLNHALYLINNRPRKCLGWMTAHEAFQEELSHLA